LKTDVAAAGYSDGYCSVEIAERTAASSKAARGKRLWSAAERMAESADPE